MRTGTVRPVRHFRQRRRGSLLHATEALRDRYNRATAGARRPEDRTDLHPLFQATGDPLVIADRDKAAEVYGLTRALRPSVTLRKIAAESWGDELSSLTMTAEHYWRRGQSALRAAGEAVALGAERGCWIGVHAPVSFDHAVEQVRKALAREIRHGPAPPAGWTGEHLTVRPASGLVLHHLDAARTPLSNAGNLVRDDAFWRRRIQDGDVIVVASEKNTQR